MEASSGFLLFLTTEDKAKCQFFKQVNQIKKSFAFTSEYQWR